MEPLPQTHMQRGKCCRDYTFLGAVCTRGAASKHKPGIAASAQAQAGSAAPRSLGGGAPGVLTLHVVVERVLDGAVIPEEFPAGGVHVVGIGAAAHAQRGRADTARAPIVKGQWGAARGNHQWGACGSQEGYRRRGPQGARPSHEHLKPKAEHAGVHSALSMWGAQHSHFQATRQAPCTHALPSQDSQ